MERRLDGRRVLVTGGGSGIGRASVERAARDGAAVAVTDVRIGLAEEAAESIIGAGGRAIALACDVADEDQVARAAAEAVERFGGLDGVVAAAGIATAGRTHDLTLHDWEMVLRVNLTGVFLTLKHTLPSLVSAGRGTIVTIGSVSSLVIGAGGSAASYKAAKGGVLQLTKAVAVEYASAGVTANCVCPGAVATNLGRHARELAADTTTPRGEAADPIVLTAPISPRGDARRGRWRRGLPALRRRVVHDRLRGDGRRRLHRGSSSSTAITRAEPGEARSRRAGDVRGIGDLGPRFGDIVDIGG